MTFSIKFITKDTKQEIPNDENLQGIITINLFQEHFDASLSFWSIADYENHWEKELRKVVDDSLSSCLITSMYDPKHASYVFWWVLYPSGDKVYVQNQILFLDQLASEFNADKPYSFIPEREVIDEDGNKISEWTTSIQDLKDFLENIN